VFLEQCEQTTRQSMRRLWLLIQSGLQCIMEIVVDLHVQC